MGLGSAWLDTLPEREIKQLLHVPRRLKFVACIPVGYPAQTLTPPPRKPLEEIIHYEKYGEKRF
jgi:nitroreductase